MKLKTGETMKKCISEGASLWKKGATYSLNHKNGCRSKHRTDILHRGYLDNHFNILGLNQEEWEVFHEEKIEDSRLKATLETGDLEFSTFTIDVVLKHKATGVTVRLLFKSIEKSYNKNRHNFANTNFGEIVRIHAENELNPELAESRMMDITVFITFLPEKITCGVSDTTGLIKVESVQRAQNSQTAYNSLHDKVFFLNYDLSVDNPEDIVDFESHINSVSGVKNAEELELKYANLRKTIDHCLANPSGTAMDRFNFKARQIAGNPVESKEEAEHLIAELQRMISKEDCKRELSLVA